MRFWMLISALILLASTLDAQGKPARVPLKWKFDKTDAAGNAKVFPEGIEIVRAEEGEYIQVQKTDEGLMLFNGGIILRYKGTEFRAEQLKFNPKTSEIYGEGNVSVKDGDRIITGQKFIFDNNKKIGIIYWGEARFQGMNFKGKKITVVPSDMYVMSLSSFSGCEIENPHYFFRAGKIWISPQNEVIALSVIYYVGQTPVFYLPILFQTNVGTGVNTLYGYNNATGHFLQNTLKTGHSDKKTSIWPQMSHLMADYYQHNGWYIGVYLGKKRRNLLYDFNLGVARYLYKDVVTDSNGNSYVTNYLDLGGGKIGTKEEYWYELDININGTWNESLTNDRSSKIQIEFLDYSSNTFTQNYKERHIPENTLDAIWYDRSLPHIYGPVNDLTWKLLYTDNWPSSHLSVKVQRQQKWSTDSTTVASGYYPVNDVLPEIVFTKNWRLMKPSGALFQGAQNELYIAGAREKIYQFGNSMKTISYYNLTDITRFYFPIAPFLSLTPGAGVGVYGRVTEFDNAQNQITEDDRKTYQFALTQNELRLGVPELFLKLRHELQYALNRSEEDPYFGNQLLHQVFVNSTLDLAPFFYVSLQSSRDLRDYKENVAENDRWNPLSTILRFDYDFINKVPAFGFGKTSRKNYLGFTIENTYDYSFRFERSFINTFSFFLQMGGYKFLFLEEIIKLRTGITWVHDFHNSRRNQILYQLDTEVQLHKYWKLLAKVQSRAINNVNNNQEPYQGFTDEVNGQKSPFFLDEVSATLEHDLHKWVLSFSYSLRRTWISHGVDNQQWAGFYEQAVYVSFNLTDFPGLGIPETKIYQYDPASEINYN